MKSSLPKVLHPVCGMPMVGHVLRECESLHPDKIIVVAGSGADQVRPYVEKRVEVAIQDPPRGTGHALMQTNALLKNFVGSVVVLCGDAPLIQRSSLEQLVRLRHESKASAAVLAFGLQNPKGYGRIIRNAEGLAVKIVEELNATDEQRLIQEVNSGIYCFQSEKLFSALERVQPDPIKNEIYLTDVIEYLSRDGEVRVLVSDNPDQMLGVNSRKDLMKVNQIRNQQNLERLMESGVTVLDDGTVFVGENVQIGKDTVLYPNTVIDSDCTIGENCHIGPFAHIRSGVVLGNEVTVGNFVEVTRSTVGNQSRVKHLAYIGDSKIGDRVNVGAGTITANYDGKNKHSSVIEDGASIGSGTVLVAPTK
ncbi:MAG: NTP transferase domain-containing protein, partial [Candidatus Omnitrophica bacterium]|nr:NTP transferase domain-containing protein [Candidatus Omnitrophota bacterium]